METPALMKREPALMKMFQTRRLHAGRSGEFREKKRARSGVASVELALILPALIALTIGTIDICTMIFLKETAVLAAYEGSRRGVARGRTNADVTSRVLEFLDERGVNYDSGSVVSIGSPGFEDAMTLENVSVTVRIPASENLLIPSSIVGNLIVEASVTMRKEYQNLDD